MTTKENLCGQHNLSDNKNLKYFSPAIVKQEIEKRGYVLDDVWEKYFFTFKIFDYEFVQLALKDIYIDDWQDENMGTPVKIKDSPNYKYLCGDKTDYINRCKNEPSHSCEMFDKLIEKLDNEGVDSSRIICVDQDNHIIDGAHRASWLVYKYGEDYKITVLKVFFDKDKQKGIEKMSDKKIICISGNCVSETIPVILKTSEQFTNNYEIIELKPIYLVKTEEDISLYKNLISECDVFVTMPIGGEKYKQMGLDTTSIKEHTLKPDAKLYKYAPPFFRGYFPEQFYLHDADGNLIGSCEGLSSPYHNSIIFYGYVNKLSIEETYNMLYDEKSIQNVEKITNESIIELQNREKSCDISISNFIAENYKTKRLFWTINHPTNALIFEISKQMVKILENIDGQQYNVQNMEKEFLNSYITPILPSVAKILDFEMTDNWNNKKYSFEDIKAAYDYYDRHPELVELNKKILDDM